MNKKKQRYLNSLYTYNSRRDEYEISLSLKNYEEIYNPFDYSQYKKRDMDEDFLDYIYHSTLDIPLKHKVKLGFHLKEKTYDEEKSKNLKNAVKNNYKWRKSLVVNQLKDKLKECVLLFAVGIIFLILAFAVFPMINGNSGFLDVIGESISIIGWVFLWDLTEILCFNVTKLHKKKRYLDRLINSRVEFETY